MRRRIRICFLLAALVVVVAIVTTRQERQAFYQVVGREMERFTTALTDLYHKVRHTTHEAALHSEDYDFNMEPIAPTDSSALDLKREGKENVNIIFYEEEPWYLTGEDLREYYKSGIQYLEKKAAERADTQE